MKDQRKKVLKTNVKTVYVRLNAIQMTKIVAIIVNII